jgi:hypothetical protein
VSEHKQLDERQCAPCGHAWLHVPQLLSSLVRSAQNEPPPEPQTLSPGFGHGLQAEPPSTPARHISLDVHITPHLPQLFGSVVMSVHWPLHTVRGALHGPASSV